MFDLDRYFDRRAGNVLMQDPEKLDLEASWLFRETADGWTLARRLERVRADLELLLRGWIPTDEVQAAAAILADWRIVLAGGSLALEHGLWSSRHWRSTPCSNRGCAWFAAPRRVGAAGGAPSVSRERHRGQGSGRHQLAVCGATERARIPARMR